MEKTNLLIADGLAAEGKKILESISEINLLDETGIDREALKKKLPKVQILVVRSRTKVDKELLEYGPDLKVVLRAGIGLDNVDIDAATECGIVVMNAPTGNIVTTAEHTLALLFSISRHIARADASVREGRWDKKKFQGNEITGKTIGIIGLGNIGQTVAKKAIALGMKAIGHDPYLSKEAAAKQNIRLVPLETLFTDADYITVHVPLNESTEHLIGKAAFDLMKPTTYLINCARGGIVDEAALIEALENKKITGCALDVFEKEPLPADHPFTKMDNIVMTPHLGASTDEAQVQVSLEVADQLTQYVREGVLRNAVNVPNISLEQLEVIKPLLTLSEKIGSFLGQTASKHVTKIGVRFEGGISPDHREVLKLSVLKGFLAPFLNSTVNFVNARKLCKERGIEVDVTFNDECVDYASLVQVSVEGDETLTCAGTIFGKKEARFVKIDNFLIDADPHGYLLFTRNSDEPGVIGSIGTEIGNQGINIARMHLGVDRAKKLSMALINIDSKLTPEMIETLRKIKGMISVQQVQL